MIGLLVAITAVFFSFFSAPAGAAARGAAARGAEARGAETRGAARGYVSVIANKAALSTADDPGFRIRNFSRKISGFSPQRLLIAENSSFETFDPFVDYNEFQDDQMEEEGVNFLKNGRLLTVSVVSGYEGMTLSMRRIYGDFIGTVGANISFFFDLRLAMQLGLIFPRGHYFNILQSAPVFSSYHLDFKYYFSKQNLIRGLAVLNPYVIFGPFLLQVSDFFPTSLLPQKEKPPDTITTPTAGPGGGALPVQVGAKPPPAGVDPATATLAGAEDGDPCASQLERQNTAVYSKAGFKAGLGLEMPLFKKTFLGFEISYLYAPLPFQGKDLSELKVSAPPPPVYSRKRSAFARLIEPAPPQTVRGKRFAGDMVHGVMILGVNF